MHTQLPDINQFNIKECEIAGDLCVLVTPKDMGVDWNDSNKIFRSSVWRKSDMFPVSLGFKKFTNYGEKPEFEPISDSNDIEYTIKKDGSCLIVSMYKGSLIVRTRGTIDATQLSNGSEIELLKQKYPKAFNNLWLDSENYTLLFEWTTPSNRIVLNETSEPTLWLIGVVAHQQRVHPNLRFNKLSYSYFTQQQLDMLAEYIQVERPDRFRFDSINSAINFIAHRADIEGLVMYADEGQCLKKIKTPSYIHKHRVYTGIKNVDHVVDLWVDRGCLERDEFERSLSTDYDYELVTAIQSLIDELYSKWSHIQSHIKQIEQLINEIKHLSRKEIAMIIIEKTNSWSKIAFNILDGKKNDVKKMFTLI